MRRFALGCLLYSPARFGKTKVGDFLDAMAGYCESENNRIKSIAAIVRTSTGILWNLQVAPENRLSPSELWPLPWDKQTTDPAMLVVDTDDMKRREAEMERILNNIMPD